jgi:ABC-type amino acid transport substrate-binding protein
MPYKLMLSIIAAVVTTVSMAHAAPAAMPGWMAGAWIEATADRWAEEYWTGPRGGLMIGAGRSGKGEVLQSWEATRITAAADGRLTFWGSPQGAPPVAFAMVSMTGSEIIFANAKHDYPQRIRYWREGAMLNAEISLIDGSKPMRWHYRAMGAN